MKQRSWHVWLMVLVVGFIYAMGIYDFFMMLSHNEHYYASHNYGQAVNFNGPTILDICSNTPISLERPELDLPSG